MSQSVTSRRVRCSKYPWPLRTLRVTTAELLAGNDHPYLVGPFNSVPAVMEFLYRVEEWGYDGRLDMSEPAFFDESISGTLTLEIALNSEIGKFRTHRFRQGGARPTTVELADVNDSDFFFMQALYGLEPLRPADPPTEIYHDTDLGEYWIHGRYVFTFDDGSLGFEATNDINRLNLSGADPNIVDVLLNLNSGPQTLKAIVGTFGSEAVESFSLTITATKWHSYGGKYDVDTGNLA